MTRKHECRKWLTLAGLLLGCGGRTIPLEAMDEVAGGSPSTGGSGGSSVQTAPSGGVDLASSTARKFTCEPGTRFCVCGDNQSCNRGLMCASGFCVDASSPASGGASMKSHSASTARAGSSATAPTTGGSNTGGSNTGASGATSRSSGSTSAGAPTAPLGGTGGSPPKATGGHAGRTTEPQCSEYDRRLGCCGYVAAAGAAGAGNPTLPNCRTEFEEQRNGFCVAKLVTIGATGIHVSIDATEVTRAQYAEWLATNPEPTQQDHLLCSANTSFVPDSDCMNGAHVCKGDACGNHPQACVDWCDARAYCNGIGKRLCGKIGGGHNPFENAADATQSEWYFACSSDGLNLFPYGSSYVPSACHTEIFGDAWSTQPVSTGATCQSSCAFGGVFDLNGNVMEWEDSCITDRPEPICHARGGSVGSGDGSSLCAYMAASAPHMVTDYSIGFRCCGP